MTMGAAALPIPTPRTDACYGPDKAETFDKLAELCAELERELAAHNRPMVNYSTKHCQHHYGMPWTMTIKSSTLISSSPIATVCPICNPPN